jgi:hypothetical protein
LLSQPPCRRSEGVSVSLELTHSHEQVLGFLCISQISHGPSTIRLRMKGVSSLQHGLLTDQSLSL